MNHVRGKRPLGLRLALNGPVLAVMAVLVLLHPVAAQPNPWRTPGSSNPWYPSAQALPGTAWPSPPQQAAPRPQHQLQPQSQHVARPKLAVSLEADGAYVHQGLVVKLEIVSEGNLSRIDVTLPRSQAVIFRSIGTPSARAETLNGQRRIVNVRHYHLVPLQPGRLRLDPIAVSGNLAGDGGAFTVKASRGIELNVLPPEDHVEPWLPLHDLQVSAKLAGDEIIDIGRPLKLAIEQRAVGMVGAQLPSPEKQLRSERLQVYRDGSDFEATIAANGRLIGKRTDRFTLVPLQPGGVDIPGVAVTWWNVDKRRREESILPGRRVVGRSGDNVERGRAEGAGTSPASERMALETPLIWGGMVLFAFFVGLGWRGLAERLRRWDQGLMRGRVGAAGQLALQHAGNSLAHAIEPAVQLGAAVRRRLSPRRNYHRLRSLLAASLPRPLRLWFCVRTVELEKNPEDWASMLRFVLEKRLGISAQKPMSELAAEIAALHPGSDLPKLGSLLRQLEAASFGRQPLADFEGWKKEFMRQISPHPWTWIEGRSGHEHIGGLPDLNPEIK